MTTTGYVLAVIVGLTLLIVIINILQKGGAYKGEAPQNILGKSLEQTTVDDVLRLSKARFVQLFYALSAPDIAEMNGEYKALNHPGGIMAPGVQLYTDHIFGHGKWIGKAFLPRGGNQGFGYNIFEAKDKNGKAVITRERQIDTCIGKSAWDNKDSFHLDYSKYNGREIHSMHDELRKLNDKIYIGMGYMGLGGGSINPSLFMVVGEPAPWVGLPF